MLSVHKRLELQMEATNEGDREVLTVEEAAELLRIGRGTAYEAVRLGEIPSIRIGRRVLVPRRPLMRLLGRAE